MGGDGGEGEGGGQEACTCRGRGRREVQPEKVEQQALCARQEAQEVMQCTSVTNAATSLLATVVSAQEILRQYSPTTEAQIMSTKDVKFQPVPVFRISLDHAPVERWNDVCDAYGHHFPPLLKR